ncbi:MAG: asparagine--tRNA ligase [Candidatus Diapherotrites archaeon]|nr:asparagine--tRNA ligase [Candidatus Diapherotrites archaeon]
MAFKHIAEIPGYVGKEVALRGWVHRHRATKNNVFIVLRDSTGVVQCVVKKDAKFFEDAERVGIETSIAVKGTVKKDERAPGGHELTLNSFKVVGPSEEFPITKDQSTEFLLDVRHLWLRSQRMTQMMKARAYLLGYFRDWFKENGFWEVSPPILTVTGCEGGSTLFSIDYFGRKAYLSQSAQLYLEAISYSLERVYSLTPSFRAEKSRTTRHLIEYWHLEAEEAFVDNEGNMKIEEELISYACQKLAKEHPQILKFFGREPKEMLAVKPPFERLSYDEMLEELKHKGIDLPWGEDPGAKEEKALTMDRKKPLFVYNYPRGAKAFYMKKADEKHVACADLLAPEGHGEIIGGSERIWDLKELLQSIKEFGLNPKDYEWYVDLRRYGSVPHSGFGLGVERTLKWILKLEHIRDAVPFPRTINRVYP